MAAAVEDLSADVEPIPDAVRRDPIFLVAGLGLRRWVVFAAVVAGSLVLLTRPELLVATHPAWPLRLVELRAVWATAFAPVIAAVVATVAGIVGDWLDGLV